MEDEESNPAEPVEGKTSLLSKLFYGWMALGAIVWIGRGIYALLSSIHMSVFMGVFVMLLGFVGFFYFRRKFRREAEESEEKALKDASIKENLDGAASWLGESIVEFFCLFVILKGFGIFAFGIFITWAETTR